MTNELTYEQETVRVVFGAYINDLKVYSSKPDRPTLRKLEEVRNKAIKALEQGDILDKIKAEIEETYINITYQENKDRQASWGLRKALEILDKYREEDAE